MCVEGTHHVVERLTLVKAAHEEDGGQSLGCTESV